MTASHLESSYMTDSQQSPVRKRARQQGQKLERREAILLSAWNLFQQSSYEALTMDTIAREAQLAKGTLFLYFRTKEELFLALTLKQLTYWFDGVDQQLAILPLPAEPSALVEMFAVSLRERSGFTRLLAILATALEQNSSVEAILVFKQELLGRMLRTGGLLEQALPFLSAGEGARLLMQFQALVIGLQHLANPAPAVQQVISAPALQVFQVDFDREFRSMAFALLKGLEKR
ncbi:MAG: TetR/AcrR family transcriptional regulator [Chloroflexi bacterium HGW-Chloroflexi-6]|nr:MAG: TetR/AcrR family transcriptional regulator [Chloroflexi bacterium HGW-Chloroflexi-6]